MVISCTTQSGTMYHDTHVTIFFTNTPLDEEGITNVFVTSSVHVVVGGRNNGSFMDFMEPFGYA